MKRCRSIQSQIKEVKAYISFLQLTGSFVNLAKELFVVFGGYSQPSFLAIITGLLLSYWRKTITSCIRLRGAKNHFSSIHRFLSQYRWEPKLLALCLANLIIQKLGIHQLIPVIHDTLVVNGVPDMLCQLKAKSIERTTFTILSPNGHKVKKIQALVKKISGRKQQAKRPIFWGSLDL